MLIYWQIKKKYKTETNAVDSHFFFTQGKHYTELKFIREWSIFRKNILSRMNSYIFDDQQFFWPAKFLCKYRSITPNFVHTLYYKHTNTYPVSFFVQFAYITKSYWTINIITLIIIITKRKYIQSVQNY